MQVQGLTDMALVRLKALDNSEYKPIADSRNGLTLLATVVASSSLASTDLARVVVVNPYEGAPFSDRPGDDEAMRTARHAKAIPKMNQYLADAVHGLDLCANGCLYLAHSITKGLSSAPDHKKAAVRQPTSPALTVTQYNALTALNGGGKLYESADRGFGVTRVATEDGTRVSIATFRALEKRQLVTVDSSTSLSTGQKITVTERGRHALDQPRPDATATTTAAVPAKPAVAQRAHR